MTTARELIQNRLLYTIDKSEFLQNYMFHIPSGVQKKYST